MCFRADFVENIVLFSCLSALHRRNIINKHQQEKKEKGKLKDVLTDERFLYKLPIRPLVNITGYE